MGDQIPMWMWCGGGGIVVQPRVFIVSCFTDSVPGLELSMHRCFFIIIIFFFYYCGRVPSFVEILGAGTCATAALSVVATCRNI
jgi:hypothetical protein